MKGQTKGCDNALTSVISCNMILPLVLRLSYVIKSHRAQYYDMFKTTNDKRNFGDMTRFVVGFLQFIHEASEQVLSFLHEKNSLLHHYGAMVKKLGLEPKTMDLLFVLVQVSVCESDSLSIAELADACDSSAYIVRKHLGKIEPYAICSHQGRALTYRADLEALDGVAADE